MDVLRRSLKPLLLLFLSGHDPVGLPVQFFLEGPARPWRRCPMEQAVQLSGCLERDLLVPLFMRR